jgi:sulfonate transport system substrate-binding protein
VRAASATGVPAPAPALWSLFDRPGDGLYARIEETVMRAAYGYCDRNQLQTARLLGLSRNVVRARLLQSGEIVGASRRGASVPVPAPAGPTVRVGYQQFGLLWLLRASGALDRAFAACGVAAAWTEYPSGVELVEALRVGELDLGVVGEGPPLIAQAQDAAIVYLAAEPPAPGAEAIVVPRGSSVHHVAELRGKRVVLNRGANVHYLFLRALEEVDLSPEDVDLVFASPTEGRAAFESGRADAWAIWDPWLAAVEQRGHARVLRDATGLASNRAYYVAARAFAEAHPTLIDVFIAEIRTLGRTANDNTEAVAELLAPLVGVETPALLTALRRSPFGLRLFDDELCASQQRVADSSHRHRLIPRAVRVADAGWVRPSRGAAG